MRPITASAEEVRAAVSMPAAIEAVRSAFIGFAAGEFEMPTRTVLDDGGVLVMSTFHRPTRSVMVKTLTLNFDRRPAIDGSVAWGELARTGQVIADAGAVTALRTGAVSGVATDLLASPDAARLVVIGTGPQGEYQARAVAAVRPIRHLTLVGRDQPRAEALAERLRGDLPEVEVVTDANVDRAVSGADVVCCATTASAPLFDRAALQPRVHVNAVGAYRPDMSELSAGVLAGASVLLVDEVGAILEESGEIIDALRDGAIRRADLVELGVALTAPPAAEGLTVFKSVGVAIQDWAIARVLAHALA